MFALRRQSLMEGREVKGNNINNLLTEQSREQRTRTQETNKKNNKQHYNTVKYVWIE